MNTFDSQPYPQTVSVVDEGHGMYTTVSDSPSVFSELDSDDNAISLKLISEAGIYEAVESGDAQEGEYFLNVAADTFQLVNEVNFNLLDPEEMEDLFIEYNVAEEIQADLRDASQRVLNGEGGTSTVVLYTANSPMSARAVTSNHYTYKGAAVRDDIVSYKNEEIDGKEVASGKDIIGTAKKLVSAEIEETVVNQLEDHLTGFTKYLKFFSKGISFFNAFKEYYDDNHFSPDHEDHINFSTQYDKYEKITYVDHHDGYGYQIGARTMYVNFKSASLTASLWEPDGITGAGGGERIKVSRNADAFKGSYYTTNYTNPIKYAYGASVGGVVYLHTEELSWKVVNKWFHA
ncbi:MAG: hypothetical protein HFH27_11990 [Clostridiaceae bacterium]|nr:hypothetical protein [Clostridiaceae bacterium]